MHVFIYMGTFSQTFNNIQSLNPANKIKMLCSRNIVLLKVKEEFEVFDNRAPVLVYSHPLGPHQTFYKVSHFLLMFGYELIFCNDLIS